jgi:hypothetical protein
MGGHPRAACLLTIWYRHHAGIWADGTLFWYVNNSFWQILLATNTQMRSGSSFLHGGLAGVVALDAWVPGCGEVVAVCDQYEEKRQIGSCLRCLERCLVMVLATRPMEYCASSY